MPFALPPTINWLKHRLLAAKRVLYKQKSTYFIDLYKQQNMTVLKDSSGILLCPICGFCMAEWLLEQGWIARACSANGFRDTMNNPHFNKWQNRLIVSQSNINPEISDNLSMSSK